MKRIPITGAELYLDEHFLAPGRARVLFESLLRECAWRRRDGTFGRPVPRDEAYYGDLGTSYTYSHRRYDPLPWIADLLGLKELVEEATPVEAYADVPAGERGYNAVLCNLYRDENDSVGLHADAEPEMGPVIASVSLGAPRRFRLKHKKGASVFSEVLPGGSLLIMAGETQRHFVHEVSKERNAVGPRINLTFRRIRLEGER